VRARILTTGLLVAVAAACSEPAPEPELDREEAALLDARLELALSAAGGAEAPIASDVEMNLPPKPAPSTPRTQSQRQKVAPIASAPPVEPMGVAVQHDHATAPDPEPTLVSEVLNPRVDPDAAKATGPSAEPTAAPAAPAKGGRGKPMPGEVVDVGRSGPGRGPVVIIRGGGSGNDPCAIHMPRGGRGIPVGIIQEGIEGRVGGLGGSIGAVMDGIVDRGAGGALINERAPRTTPSFSPPRTGTSRGMPRSRGGIRF
jgi:hypothetical protein